VLLLVKRLVYHDGVEPGTLLVVDTAPQQRLLHHLHVCVCLHRYPLSPLLHVLLTVRLHHPFLPEDLLLLHVQVLILPLSKLLKEVLFLDIFMWIILVLRVVGADFIDVPVVDDFVEEVWVGKFLLLEERLVEGGHLETLGYLVLIRASIGQLPFIPLLHLPDIFKESSL